MTRARTTSSPARPVRRRSARFLGAGAATAAAVLLFTACNDDGRTMRPPRPDQTASVSTTAPPPTEFPQFGTDTAITVPTTTAAPATTAVSPSTTLAGSTVESTTATLPAEEPDPVLTVSWRDGAPIDARHTCDGANLSPALRWTTPPADTVEIAVTMTDLDAPDFVHWAVAGMDPLSTSLGEAQVPEFARLGLNSLDEFGYTGPCPPPGEEHTYVLTVHFLETPTELPDGTPGADLIAEIEAATLASATVTGVYSRP